MKKLAAAAALVTFLLIPVGPAAAHTAYPDGSVNIRSGPGLKYGVVGSLSDGQGARILGSEGQWLKIRTSAGTVGFVADWVVRQVFDDETLWVQVDADVLNLRAGAGSDAAVVAQLYRGEQYRLLESLGGWVRLSGARGTGWASGQYVFRVQPPPGDSAPVPPAAGTDSDGLGKQVAAAARASIHSGRDSRFARQGTVMPGEMLTYLGAAEGWVQVAKADGQKGWIDGNFVYLWDQSLRFMEQASYGMIPDDWRIRFLPVREVTQAGEGLRIRSGPTAASEIIRTLSAGDPMKLLEVSAGEFVRVVLADGTTGWVSRNWIRPVPGLPTESVRISSLVPGVVRIEVSGHVARPSVVALDGELRIGLPENTARKAALPVGKHGLSDMVFGPSGLTVGFEVPYSYRIVEQNAEKTVVEIRPVVTALERLVSEDRVRFRLHTTGVVTPVASRQGVEIQLTLPGALLAAEVQAPAGISLEQGTNAVVASVRAGAPYAVQTGNGYVDLVVLRSGLSGKVIVIDPGHGGAEPGAVGPTGLREKDANLEIALRLKERLEAAGARVIMTRSGDTRCASPGDLAGIPRDEHLRFDLNCRSALSNSVQADAFVSVHGNGHPNREENGTETFWTVENRNASRSRELAALVQSELVRELGLKDRGAKQEMFYVIKHAAAPAVLAEVAFVGHPAEETLLKDPSFRRRSAEAMYRALNRFFQ